MLNRDQIRAMADIRQEIVEVPEWGGSVTVIGMDGRARDAFSQAIQSGDKSISFFQTSLIVATCVGDDAKPLFSVDDIEWLRGKSASALARLARVAERLNGFGEAAVENAAKNSEAAPSGSSGSA